MDQVDNEKLILREEYDIRSTRSHRSIYDATNSYDISFYSAGALLFVTYTTNEEYLASVPEEGENEAVSPDAGVGIVLDIKPKDFAVVMQESGENKIVLDASQNEKGKESVSSL
ncbi:hypothetical protein E2C01_025405 [Portunus trituberculatus]|uniref:Uncharacterized protein n=1 Tax=Portunus trituberculatus TaxID=210409 RepID=A0A5B7ECV2_PORTR|nr:hypothetical protein [Portunus trituberculatus]